MFIAIELPVIRIDARPIGRSKQHRIFRNAASPPCSGLAHLVKNGPTEMRILSTSKMHYVSQITSPLRLQHSGSIDTTVRQNLGRSDISTDDGDLPNPLARACTHRRLALA